MRRGRVRSRNSGGRIRIRIAPHKGSQTDRSRGTLHRSFMQRCSISALVRGQSPTRPKQPADARSLAIQRRVRCCTTEEKEQYLQRQEDTLRRPWAGPHCGMGDANIPRASRTRSGRCSRAVLITLRAQSKAADGTEPMVEVVEGG
jgi:hypothetical protein